MEESSSEPVQDDMCALPKVEQSHLTALHFFLHQGVSDSAYVLNSREESQVVRKSMRDF